jgi:hypothetical protein
MVRVVTDSSCDLPQEVVEELGIVVVPLVVRDGCGFVLPCWPWGDGSDRGGKTLNPPALRRALRLVPTSAQIRNLKNESES